MSAELKHSTSNMSVYLMKVSPPMKVMSPTDHVLFDKANILKLKSLKATPPTLGIAIGLAL